MKMLLSSYKTQGFTHTNLAANLEQVKAFINLRSHKFICNLKPMYTYPIS